MGLILRDTFGLLRAALPVVALLVLLPSLFQGLGLNVNVVTELMLIAISSYFLHRQFLLGEPLGKPATGNGAPGSAFWPYLLLTAVLIALFIALAAGLMRGAGYGRIALAGLGLDIGPITGTELAGPVWIGCMFLAQIVVLGLFGTALPATAVRGVWGPGVRAQRFPGTPLRIAMHLIAGPWLICTLGLLALLALAQLVLPPLPDPSRPAITLPGLGLILGGRLVVTFALAMTVVILSRIYLENTEPRRASEPALAEA